MAGAVRPPLRLVPPGGGPYTGGTPDSLYPGGAAPLALGLVPDPLTRRGLPRALRSFPLELGAGATGTERRAAARQPWDT